MHKMSGGENPLKVERIKKVDKNNQSWSDTVA